MIPFMYPLGFKITKYKNIDQAELGVEGYAKLLAPKHLTFCVDV